MRISFVVYLTCLLITIWMIGGCQVSEEVIEGRDINQIIDWLEDYPDYGKEMAKEALKKHGPDAPRYLIRRLNDENELIRDGVIDILRSEYQPYIVENLDWLIFDEDPLIRRGALAALNPLALGLEDAAFPLIKEALTDKEKSVRYEAAFIFAERGKPFRGVIENLIPAANSRMGYFRQHALTGFGSLDKFPIEAVPGYIQGLEDGPGPRSIAVHVLEEIGFNTVFALISGLGSSDTAEREALISQCIKYGFEDPKPWELLIPLMTIDDPAIRSRAVYYLGELKEDIDDFVLPMSTGLKDRDAGVRYNTAVALGKIGAPSVLALHTLGRKTREDDSPEVRQAAGEAIRKITVNPDLLVQPLIDALMSNQENRKYLAVRAIEMLGPDAKDTVPAMAKLFEHNPWGENLWLLQDVAYAAAAIGPDAAKLMPAISVLLADADISNVKAGIIAVQAIEEDPLPYLIKHFRKTDPEFSTLVIQTMASIGYESAGAFPYIDEKLSGNSFGTRYGYETFLEGGYPDVDFALSTLKEALKKRSRGVRQWALFMYAVINPDPDEALDFTLKFINDKDPCVRAVAAITLGYLGPGMADKTKPYLVEMLDDESTFVFCFAVTGIGMLFEEARDLLPMLYALLENPPPDEGRFAHTVTYLRSAIIRIELGRMWRVKYKPQDWEWLYSE